MNACRDWLLTLWPASYRGVPFQVEKDSGEYGKRAQIHEYPNKDVWYVEELGKRATRFRVTAYLASDTIDAELGALVEVCTRRGSGTLVLPLEGPRQAFSLKCQTNRHKDKHGYIAVELEFVEDPGLGPAPFPAPYFAGKVGQAAAILLDTVAAAFADVYQASGVPDHVIEASAAEVEAVATALEVERGTARFDVAGDPALAAAAGRALVDLFAGALPLARGEAVPIGAAVEVSGIPAAVAATVEAYQSAAEISAAPAALRRAILALPIEAYATEPAAVRTTAEVADRQARLVRRAVVSTLVARHAVSIAELEFASRREAIQARADVAELFEIVIAAAETAEEVASLTATRNAAIEYVSRTIADLAPVIEVAARRSMPAVWWAHRLYGDASRAGELVARNGVSHPSFMPGDIEALAR